MTDLCRLAEWKTRTKDYLPFPDKGSTGARVDKHAVPLRDRWIYALVHSRTRLEGFSVPFEGFVDDGGFVWSIPEVDPSKFAIPDRPDPKEYGTVSDFIQFPIVNDAGEALKTRLLCSPFRLSKQALASINEPAYHKSIRKQIPPLWEWKPATGNSSSPIVSIDEWELDINPMWLTFPGESTPTPVLIGSDPFAIARKKSDRFVRRRKAYVDQFEATKGDRAKEIEKINLARSITNLLLTSDESRKEYGKSLDIGRMNKEVGDFEKEQREAVAKITKAVRPLTRYLSSPLFSFLQYSSLEAENYDDVLERSDALIAHLETIDIVSRQLDTTIEGIELILRWVKEASKSSHHFFNRVVAPTEDTAIHVFKSFRWAGKAVLSIHNNLVPWLLLREEKPLQTFGKIVKNHGIIPSIGKLADGLKQVPVAFATALDLAELTSKVAKKLKVDMLGEPIRKAYAAFAKEGAKLGKYFPPQTRSGQFLAVTALDAINVILAIRALRKAEGDKAIIKAASGTTAAVGFFGASIYKAVVDSWEDGTNKKKSALRAIRGTQCACAFIYGVLDTIAAFKALDQDDNDRAAALFIAAAAEFGTMITYGVLIFTGGAGVVALTVLGTIAAIAYIAAMFLKNDPLQQFLTNCEWGSERYGDPKFHPIWAEDAVAKWESNIGNQSRILLRLLSRLKLRWDFELWPSVEVSTSLCRSGFQVRVEFIATFADGTTSKRQAIYPTEEMPPKPPLEFVVDPGVDYKELPGIRDVVCKVHYRSEFGAEEETIEGTLMKDGHGDTNELIKRVPD